MFLEGIMALIFETEKWKHKDSMNMYVLVLNTLVEDEKKGKEKVIFTYDFCNRHKWLVTDKKEFTKYFEKVRDK